MTDFQRYGNTMMTGIDRDPKPNPDDYSICPECGEQVHNDDMVHHTAEYNETVCVLCFRKTEHVYRCDDCEMEFTHKGVPARCKNCGRFKIHDGNGWNDVDSLIHEEQERFLKEAQNAPLMTPAIISSEMLASVRSKCGSIPDEPSSTSRSNSL